MCAWTHSPQPMTDWHPWGTDKVWFMLPQSLPLTLTVNVHRAKAGIYSTSSQHYNLPKTTSLLTSAFPSLHLVFPDILFRRVSPPQLTAPEPISGSASEKPTWNSVHPGSAIDLNPQVRMAPMRLNWNKSYLSLRPLECNGFEVHRARKILNAEEERFLFQLTSSLPIPAETVLGRRTFNSKECRNIL